jgi:MtN3 and saliva related transmembrane protein
MFESLVPWIATLAGTLTSLSYVPQVKKAWPRGSTSDLSLKTLSILTFGLLLWLGYGALKKDWVIVVANGVGAALSASVLMFKIRDVWSKRATTPDRHAGLADVSNPSGTVAHRQESSEISPQVYTAQ